MCESVSSKPRARLARETRLVCVELHVGTVVWLLSRDVGMHPRVARVEKRTHDRPSSQRRESMLEQDHRSGQHHGERVLERTGLGNERSSAM
ncbi:hypothetical protein HMPREF1868_01944 [Olsenella sp. DNF00959]|nr:hypothetical protein HMPREF1868_01944 [Olsenella sp. DNF00959]